MLKLVAVVSSLLVSLGLAAYFPPQPPGPDGPEPPKAKGKEQAKKKGEPGPRGDLTKAYDLLRRLRADDSTVGRSEERIRHWTKHTTKYYRDGLKALDAGDDFLAHESRAIAVTRTGLPTTPTTLHSSIAAIPTCLRPPAGSAPKTLANGSVAT